MNMVIPDEGKILALERWLAPDVTTGEDWHVKLYVNNYTPDDSSTSSSFTESTATGYLQFVITESNWGTATITGHVAFCTSAVVPTYTCTGGSPQTIYGWYALGATTGKVLAAQKFDSPHTFGPGTTEVLNPPTVAFKTYA